MISARSPLRHPGGSLASPGIGRPLPSRGTVHTVGPTVRCRRAVATTAPLHHRPLPPVDPQGQPLLVEPIPEGFRPLGCSEALVDRSRRLHSGSVNPPVEEHHD